MNSESVSLVGTLVNLFLAVAKLIVGVLAHSSALIADGIHSGLDIISSLVTYIGTKVAKKPADRSHPYGHYRSESIAGFIVTILLLVTAGWIIYEGVVGLTSGEQSVVGAMGIGVAIVSIVVNEIMAKVKLKIGKAERNLALIADAKHSRADSLSSVAVLVGLILTRWLAIADSLTAIFVGIFILYEAYKMGRQVTDSLLDVRNPDIEKKIRKICREQEIRLIKLRTRSLGAVDFSELKIGLNAEWKMNKVSEVTKSLERHLKKEIPELEFVVIQVESHYLESGYFRSGKKNFKELSKLKSPDIFKKKGKRTLVPVKAGKFYKNFGAPEYLIADQDDQGHVLQKKIFKNTYFHIGRGYGVQFSTEAQVDTVIVSNIGDQAEKDLRALKIKIKRVSEGKSLDDILGEDLGVE